MLFIPLSFVCFTGNKELNSSSNVVSCKCFSCYNICLEVIYRVRLLYIIEECGSCVSWCVVCSVCCKVAAS